MKKNNYDIQRIETTEAKPKPRECRTKSKAIIMLSMRLYDINVCARYHKTIDFFNRDNNAFHRFYSYNLIVSIIFLPDSLARSVFFSYYSCTLDQIRVSVVSSQNMNFYRSMVLFGRALLPQISAIGFICVFPERETTRLANRPTGKYMENLQPLNYRIKTWKNQQNSQLHFYYTVKQSIKISKKK